MRPTSSNPNLLIDFDGTVVDALGPDYELYCRSLAPVRPLPKELYLRFRRNRTPIQKILSLTPDARTGDFLDRRKALSESPDIFGAAALLPGAYDSLRELSKSFVCHLVSARSSRTLLVRQCDQLHVSAFFSDMKAVGAPENKMEVFNAYAKDAGTWAIGDTEHDIAAAHACKLPVIAITAGMRSQSFLEKLNPTKLFASLSDAAHFLLSRP
jgi:phosphoglycolate phosphatase-like HAD superfamily hydrolase